MTEFVTGMWQWGTDLSVWQWYLIVFAIVFLMTAVDLCTSKEFQEDCNKASFGMLSAHPLFGSVLLVFALTFTAAMWPVMLLVNIVIWPYNVWVFFHNRRIEKRHREEQADVDTAPQPVYVPVWMREKDDE